MRFTSGERISSRDACSPVLPASRAALRPSLRPSTADSSLDDEIDLETIEGAPTLITGLPDAQERL